MSKNFATYDACDTTVIIDGTYITGLGEDMITGEKDEDFSSESVGAQGDVVENVINNPLGTVNIKIQSTSPQRKFMDSLAKRKDPFPLWCVNKKLNERFGGQKAKLKKWPSIERGTEADELDYQFKVYDYTVE